MNENKSINSKIIKMGVLLLIITWLFTFYIINLDKKNEISNAKNNLSNLASVFEQHISTNLLQLENSLGFIKNSYQNDSDLNQTHLLLNQLVSAGSGFYNLVSVIDKSGNVLVTDQKTFNPTFSGDRSFFIYHRDNPQENLLIEPPLLGRVTGKWYLPVSMRLNSNNGEFIGVLLASVNPFYFSNIFNKVNIGDNFIVYIADKEGIIYSGVRSRNTLSVGEKINLDYKLSDKNINFENSFFEPKIQESLIDRESRIIKKKTISYNQNNNLKEMFLSLGIGEKEFLVNHKRRTSLFLIIQTILTFIILFVIYKLKISASAIENYSIELKHQKERYANILEGTNAGTWEWNVQTGEHIINEKYANICGYTLEELEPVDIRTWEKLIHPDDFTTSTKLLDEHFEGKSIYYELETRVKHKKGHWIWILDRGKLISKTEDNKPLWIYGIILDITDKKNTGEQFNLFMKNSPALTYIKEIIDNDSIVLQASDSFKDLIGKTGSEMTGKTMKDLFPPDFAQKIIRDDHEVIARNKLLRLEENFGGKTYTTIKFPIKQGERTLLAGYSIDITEIKNKEKELKSQNQLINTLLKNLNVGVYMIEAPTGKPLIANDKAMEIMGKGILPNINKKNISEIYNVKKKDTRQSYPAEEMPIIRGMYGETCFVDDMIIEKPDGQETLLEVFGSPITDENGKVWASLVSFQDITNKKHEEETKSKYQKLESLGILAGGIAHDFNNILTGVFGYIDLALFNSKDKNIKEFLKSSLKSIDRAKALSNQLLTFSKGGDPVLHPERLDILTKNTIDSTVSSSNVKVVYNIEKELQLVMIDKDQIIQVIENITQNAIEAMSDSGEITVSMKEVSVNNKKDLEKGEYIHISISDNGTGIAKSVINKVFDPFFSTKTMGQGLGLSTSFSILKKHKGCIEINSVQGTGTTVDVYIPAIKINTESVTNSPTQKTNQKLGKILVMDDEELLRDIFTELLESLGYETITSTDGNEALEIFKRDKYNNNEIIALIFDLTIPGGMGGKDAIMEVRRIDGKIPVFVASGYASDPIMSNPQKYGFTDSLKKPFNLEELSDLLIMNLNFT